MSYEQFIREMEEKVQICMKGKSKVYIRRSLKNNGYERKGIVFVEEGINISPTIYLEEYYEKFKQGYDTDNLARQLVELYLRIRVDHSWEGDFVKDYENIRDRIVYRLVNMEKNQELLKKVPYLEYLDLAILFYVLVEVGGDGTGIAAMLIRNEHLEWWNRERSELYQSAVMNTERLLPYEFSAMSAVLEEFFKQCGPEESMNEPDGEEIMYVLTNRFRNHGAAAVLYPGRLEQIGIYLEENYYILPSSIHEVLILPESKGITREEMNRIVREINGVYMQEEDVLSDHVYYYDRVKKELLI